ncbi:MAG: DEAD/DEAH box helicase family protein [Acetobacteraceae bacterium]
MLVVSDRTVLDAQLQEAIFDFERTHGVVESITHEHGSKSAQLGQALKNGKKIIVCTIQTFPFVLQAAQELAATEGKQFAVIADEAHSSQTGEVTSKLKQLLSAKEWAEYQDGGEIDTEVLLAAQMKSRVDLKGLTYIAFTATPKQKTLELFGRPGADGRPAPFHVYSMRQAVEEGFVLDVLRNYTTYKMAFKLAHDGQELDHTQVERSAALKGIMQWVRLHPYNITQKVQIVVEHYRENVQPLLNRKAKAMVVVASRKEAVRWQKAIRAYIARQRYPLKVLVAFSGEVDDQESYPDPVTESSKDLNPHLNGRDIRDAFAESDHHLLLVANKFQTGFDQSLLCGMYIDKKLGGIQAVQTLSRLNLAYDDKDTTYILDFVNEAQEILKALKTYYETAELEATTDPEQILDLRSKFDAAGCYDNFEVERVASVEFDSKGTQSQLRAAIAPVSDRLLKRYKAAQAKIVTSEALNDAPSAQAARDSLDALDLFKQDLGAYIRLYTFLSQILDYGNTDYEKRFLFYKRLLPLLDFGRERNQVDLSKISLTHHNLRNKGKQPIHLEHGEALKLSPMNAVGSGAVHDKQKALLDEIIQSVNGLFDGDLSEEDQLIYINGILKGKLLENATLVEQAANNSKEKFANSPDLNDALLDAIICAEKVQREMSYQALNSPRTFEGLKTSLLGPTQLYKILRERYFAGINQN